MQRENSVLMVETLSAPVAVDVYATSATHIGTLDLLFEGDMSEEHKALPSKGLQEFVRGEVLKNFPKAIRVRATRHGSMVSGKHKILVLVFGP